MGAELALAVFLETCLQLFIADRKQRGEAELPDWYARTMVVERYQMDMDDIRFVEAAMADLAREHR